jgi:hypothetical protein
MTLAGSFEIALTLALILVAAYPIGAFMADMFENRRTFLTPIIGPIERGLARDPSAAARRLTRSPRPAQKAKPPKKAVGTDPGTHETANNRAKPMTTAFKCVAHQRCRNGEETETVSPSIMWRSYKAKRRVQPTCMAAAGGLYRRRAREAIARCG